MESVFNDSSLDNLAKQSGFSIRNRRLNGSLFFKTVLFDHLNYDSSSLEFHSSSIYAETGLKISKQAIDKRFNEKSVVFWQQIIKSYLAKKLSGDDMNSKLRTRFKSIRIMDSTNFKLHPSLSNSFPGFDGDGTKACAKVQFEFDMLSGVVNNLSLGHVRVPDKVYGLKDMDDLQPDELLLRDLGYYNLNVYKKIEEKQALFISRLNPQLNIYTLKGNQLKRLTHKQIIQKLKKSTGKYIDIEAYLGKETRFKVRLLANLLDEHGINRRRKRIKHHKTKLSAKDQLSSQLNLFITNIQRDIPPDQIYHLYKLRWQVEIVFKAWKSILKIHKFGKMKGHRLKCYLYAKLLWALVSWDLYQCAKRIIWPARRRAPSLLKLFHQVKCQSLQLRNFMKRESGLEKWVEMMSTLIEKFGLKENKKGGVKVEEILLIN